MVFTFPFRGVTPQRRCLSCHCHRLTINVAPLSTVSPILASQSRPLRCQPKRAFFFLLYVGNWFEKPLVLHKLYSKWSRIYQQTKPLRFTGCNRGCECRSTCDTIIEWSGPRRMYFMGRAEGAVRSSCDHGRRVSSTAKINTSRMSITPPLQVSHEILLCPPEATL